MGEKNAQHRRAVVFTTILCPFTGVAAKTQSAGSDVKIDWHEVTASSRLTQTLHVLVNPQMLGGALMPTPWPATMRRSSPGVGPDHVMFEEFGGEEVRLHAVDQGAGFVI